MSDNRGLATLAMFANRDAFRHRQHCKQQSIARDRDRWRTQADGLLRPQRSDVERQSGNQEKTDEIHRIGLRRRDRPPHESFDRRYWIGVVFHAAVLLDTEGN